MSAILLGLAFFAVPLGFLVRALRRHMAEDTFRPRPRDADENTVAVWPTNGPH